MPPEVEFLPIQLVHADARISNAEFLVWDFEPDNSDWIRLGLRFEGREIVVSNENYFHAMQAIRLQLEKDELLLNCYGASRNVYPSPMSIDMGAGHKAYRLTIGEHAKISSWFRFLSLAKMLYFQLLPNKNNFTAIGKRIFPAKYKSALIFHLSTIIQVYFSFVPQTIYQLLANQSVSHSLLFWLTPTRQKSYQMVFQDVTHLIRISNIMGIRR